MKTQKITPPSGYRVDYDRSTFEEIVFKPIDNWVTSWEELGLEDTKIVEAYFEETCFIVPCTFTLNIHKYMNLQKLIDLRDHVNNGWQPVFKIDSGNEYYCIYPYDGDLGIYSALKVSAILAFKDKKTAERFLETHRELIESVKEFL